MRVIVSYHELLHALHGCQSLWVARAPASGRSSRPKALNPCNALWLQRHPVPGLVTPCRTDATGTLSPVHGPHLPWPSVSFLQAPPQKPVDEYYTTNTHQTQSREEKESQRRQKQQRIRLRSGR
ncbi:unnamed protein product [Boreogadus saida]